ncbi:Nucleotide-binding alpha-beta plait [Penicillium robsamsonii]|uniref:Nucleotide-binding alpha-beta plait n=1 Tax=Penicillium robsamsonii TaxID=1792511 RepID=UPI002546C0A3|nr:Nucleotide-binding alpha-beta plait [Penicillium robsamsonii]KAJ5823427.1 Nucleotide-binding alpha-beta plait [Penicillium robsamsonii]
MADVYRPYQRERSRSPRRRSSRSPPRRTRRSYSPRSRSRSRGERDEYRRPERRSRSPLSASGAAAPGSPFGGRSGYPPLDLRTAPSPRRI